MRPRSQDLSSKSPLTRARRDPGLVWSRASLTNWEHQGGVLCHQAVCRVELFRVATNINRDVNTNSLRAEISNSIYSGVYLKGLASLFRDNLPWSWCCCRRTHWIYGKSVIFQLWTSSSAILFRSDSYFSTVVSPLNARDQTDPEKKTIKRPLEKRTAFSK